MTTFKENYEQRVESDRLASQWNKNSLTYDFMGCGYLKIDSIRETNTKITIAVKEHWMKNPKRIVIEKADGRFLFDAQEHFRPFNITADNYDELIDCIIKVGGLRELLLVTDNRKASKTKQAKQARQAKVKEELRSTLKPGDFVQRIGKTPNLGNYIIQVEKVDDYGISGFYMDGNNLKYRTGEYTSVSWDYIKGRYDEVN